MPLNSAQLSTIIERLAVSFTEQAGVYGELDRVTRSLSGKIAMSKGDFSGVIPILEEKQQMLATLDQLKAAVADEIALWQEHKSAVDKDESATLDHVLDDLELQIKRFLNSEKQLQKQLDFYRKER